MVIELDGVGAQVLLVVLQVVDAGAHVLAAAAVVAQRDLVADVDGAEARAAAEDVDQVRDLVVGERLHLGALDRGGDPLADGGSISARVRRTSDPSPMRVGMGCSTRPPACPACRGRRHAPAAGRRSAEPTRGARACHRRILRQSWRRRRAAKRGEPARRTRPRLKGARPRGERGLVQGLWGKPSGGGSSLASERSHSESARGCCAGVKAGEPGEAPLPGLRGARSAGWGGSAPSDCGRRPAGLPLWGAASPPTLRPWFARGRGEPRRR